MSFIYAPVFTAGPSGEPFKGWTDFAAGGWCVLEDRWGASSIFEMRARVFAPTLLPLLSQPEVQADPPRSFASLVHHLAKLPGRAQAAAVEEFDRLIGVWSSQRQVDNARRESGVLVPRTWAELEDWASTSGPVRIDFYDDAQSGPEVEEFWDRLLQIAARENPSITETSFSS